MNPPSFSLSPILLAILLPIALAWLSCSPGKKISSDGIHPLSLSYQSPSEHISIQDGRISYRKTEYFYSRPQLATPDSSVKHLILDKQAITYTQLDQLKKQLEESGFFELQSVYGAPQDERSYGYAIEVYTGEQSQTVLFRSNPSYEEAPTSFHTAENLILNFAKNLLKS